MNKWFLILLVSVLLFLPLIAGCSGNDNPAAPEQSAVTDQPEEPVVEEPETEATETEDDIEDAEETGSADDDEVLFTFFTTPSDWPRAVPSIMNEFSVTSYERTENSMYAAGYGELQLSRVNNFYMNARKETGTSFDWEFDPAKESVTEGEEQVFYYIDDEGKSLTIKFREVEKDRIEFELDYKE